MNRREFLSASGAALWTAAVSSGQVFAEDDKHRNPMATTQ